MKTTQTLITAHRAVVSLLPKFELFASVVCRGDKHMQEDLIQNMSLAVLEHGQSATLSFFTSRACWSARKYLRGERMRQKGAVPIHRVPAIPVFTEEIEAC